MWKYLIKTRFPSFRMWVVYLLILQKGRKEFFYIDLVGRCPAKSIPAGKPTFSFVCARGSLQVANRVNFLDTVDDLNNKICTIVQQCIWMLLSFVGQPLTKLNLRSKPNTFFCSRAKKLDWLSPGKSAVSKYEFYMLYGLSKVRCAGLCLFSLPF